MWSQKSWSSGVSSGYSTTAFGSAGLASEESGETESSYNRATENTLTGLSGAEEPPGLSAGDVVSTVSIGSGGGGAGQGLIGGSVAASPEECSDQEILDVSPQQAYSPTDTDVQRDRSALKNCSVQVVLSSGTITSVSSSLWPSLFDLLESILENNPFFENSGIMLLVDETGTVSGPGVENDTVIELPDQSYSDCVIHIYF